MIKPSNVNTTTAFTTSTSVDVDLDFEVSTLTELFYEIPLAYTTATSDTIQVMKLNKVTSITASGDFTFSAPKTLSIRSETVAIDPAGVFMVDCVPKAEVGSYPQP